MKEETNDLKKNLTLYGLVMIAAGACIGSGIFLVPASIATTLPIPSFILIAWFIGGIFTLTGALTYAELGAKFPKTGGVYVFLREAFGALPAFLYGWSLLTVVTSGAIAALGIGFATYFNKIIGLGSEWNVMVAISAIVFLTIINIVGVKVGEIVSSTLTTLKLIGIAIVVFIGIFLYQSAPEISWTMTATAENPLSKSVFSSFSIAMIGVLWSYGGWYHASFLAGETRNAKKTVPKAMIIGTIIVMITYISINYAYLRLLPLNEIQNSAAAAADAVSKFHPSGGLFIAILIAISIFGTTSIYTMSAPRIYFAMAKDGVFFKALAKTHPYFKTPANAILIQSTWAILLVVFWQTFEDLITYVVFIDWVFLMLGALTIFIFRKRITNSEYDQDTYKTPLYPFIPAFFVIVCAILIISTLIEKPTQALAGTILLGLGFGVFYLFKKED